MKMMTYLLMVRGKDPVVPAWDVSASTDDYARVCEQYNATEGQKCLLRWSLTNGVCVLRANYKNVNFCEGMNDFDIPFRSMPSAEATGMHVPIRRAVATLLKG